MSNELQAKKIAFLLSNSGVEQAELTAPWQAVEDAGGEPTLIAPDDGIVQAFHQDVNRADTFPVDLAVSAAQATDFDALVIPGGTTNADRLRTDVAAMALVKAFVDANKPIAAICHGPWALIEAGVLSGKTLTSFPSLQTDIRNAGAQEWVDQEVFVCPMNGWTLVTSRDPDDLEAFSAALVREFAATVG